jgi:hypothetical protein
MTLFNNPRLAWRDITLIEALPDGVTKLRLTKAGFDTLGKLLDATPQQIAAATPNVGLTRARKAREQAVDAAHTFTYHHVRALGLEPETAEPETAVPERLSSRVATLIAGLSAFTVVAALAALFLPLP